MTAMKRDRRANPRVRADVPVQVVSTDEQDAMTAQAVNLSGSGVYLMLPEPIPTGTRLLISLIIPFQSQGKVDNRFFDFEGVVVRNEGAKGEEKGRYYVAVYFAGARRGDKETIDRFVRKKLGQTVT